MIGRFYGYNFPSALDLNPAQVTRDYIRVFNGIPSHPRETLLTIRTASAPGGVVCTSTHLSR